MYSKISPPNDMTHCSKYLYRRCDNYNVNAKFHDSDPEALLPSSDETATFTCRPRLMPAHDGRESSFLLDTKESRDDYKCVVCLDQEADAVEQIHVLAFRSFTRPLNIFRKQILLECGHGGICCECAGRIWAQRADLVRPCPLCRQGFSGVMRIVGRDGATVPSAPPPLLAPALAIHPPSSRRCPRPDGRGAGARGAAALRLRPAAQQAARRGGGGRGGCGAAAGAAAGVPRGAGPGLAPAPRPPPRTVSAHSAAALLIVAPLIAPYVTTAAGDGGRGGVGGDHRHPGAAPRFPAPCPAPRASPRRCAAPLPSPLRPLPFLLAPCRATAPLRPRIRSRGDSEPKASALATRGLPSQPAAAARPFGTGR